MISRTALLCLLTTILFAAVGRGHSELQEADDYYDEMIDEDFDDPVIEAVGVPTVPAMPADATPQDALEIAEASHEQALAIANQGRIQEALVHFKRAVEVWPHKDVYWSNLGVTEMRMGLLDDALFSYTRGLRLNPKSKLITENMNALKDHLAYRDQRQLGAESDISAPMEKAATSAEVSEEAVGLDGEPAPVVDSSGATDKELAQWLGPWWKKRHQLKGMFTDAMTGYKPIQIRSFLRKDKAAALHRELYESEHFKVYESYSRWYQFHFKAVYQQNKNYNDHEVMVKLAHIFDSRGMKAWIRDISHSQVNGTTISGASWYEAGDYTMPHTDRASGRDGDHEKRRVAYILHMTKEWSPRFGGDLVFMSPAYHIHPTFNTITLFPVSRASWHFVSPVASITPANVKRLAFSGWWTSTNIREANAIEDGEDDNQRHSEFALTIDGNDGAVIEYPASYEDTRGLWARTLD